MKEMGLPYELVSKKDNSRTSETYGKMFLTLTKVETNIGNTLYSVQPTLVSDEDNRKKNAATSFKELGKVYERLEEEEFKNNPDRYYLLQEQKNHGFVPSNLYDEEKSRDSDDYPVRSNKFVFKIKSDPILAKVLILTEDDIEEEQLGGCRVLDEEIEKVVTPFGMQNKIILTVEPVKKKVPLWLAKRRVLHEEMKKNRRSRGELIDMDSLLLK